MRIFADELLTVPSSGVPITLTADLYDNVGGTRSTVAIIKVLDAEINYRHNEPPTAALSRAVGTNGEFEINGYDNIASVQIAALNGLQAQVFVQYGN